MTPEIKTNFSLKNYNSFGFEQLADSFCEASSDVELEAAVVHARNHRLPVTVLGGGSNIVLTRNIPGLVIHPTNRDVTYQQTEHPDITVVQVGAGMIWDDLVALTLRKGLRGLENLTLIPGTVGAAPVQNIGAYGVEIDQRIVSVRALHLPTLQWQEFTAEQCLFTYRNSFFKQNPGQYIITRVSFALGDANRLSYAYHTLAKHLQEQELHSPDALQISAAVASIRSSRLPDPKTLGNAGSFFHNPVVGNVQAQSLKAQFPELPAFPNGTEQSKLSAAWLIDNAGFKGQRLGDVGVYERQALVLVNHGGGTGTQLLALARQIQISVKKAYDIELQIEPSVI